MANFSPRRTPRTAMTTSNIPIVFNSNPVQLQSNNSRIPPRNSRQQSGIYGCTTVPINYNQTVIYKDSTFQSTATAFSINGSQPNEGQLMEQERRIQIAKSMIIRDKAQIENRWNTRIKDFVAAKLSPNARVNIRQMDARGESLIGVKDDSNFQSIVDLLRDVATNLNQGNTLQWCQDAAWQLCLRRTEVQLRRALWYMEDTELDRLNNLSIRVLGEVCELSNSERSSAADTEQSIACILSSKSGLNPFSFFAFVKWQDPNDWLKLEQYYLPVQKFTVSEDHLFMEKVPRLPTVYTSRKEQETIIRQVMLSPRRTVLTLSGLGSSGKTTLLIYAARQALQLGFHRVLWISENTNIDQMKTSLQRQRIGKFLVVVDCADGERKTEIMRDFTAIATVKTILTATRRHDVSDHEPFDREILNVSGLSEDETGFLLGNVLGEDKITALSGAGLLPNVISLCTEWCGFPLMVRVIGGVLHDDHDRWRHQGTEYLNMLTARMERTRAEFDGRSSLPRQKDYEYENTFAAIKVSVEMLKEDKLDRYKSLVVLSGEVVTSRAAAVAWNVRDMVAEDDLNDFERRGLLTRLAYDPESQQYLFSLHDLLTDFLKSWTIKLGERTNIYAQWVDNYLRLRAEGDFDAVHDRDDLFWRNFLTWGPFADRAAKVQNCACNLRYLSRRLFLRGSDETEKDLCAMKEWNLRGNDIIDEYLIVVRRERQDQHPVQFALLRPLLIGPFRDAEKMLQNGESGCPPLLLQAPELDMVDALSGSPLNTDFQRTVHALWWNDYLFDFIIEFSEGESCFFSLVCGRKLLVATSAIFDCKFVGPRRLAFVDKQLSTVTQFDLCEGSWFSPITVQGSPQQVLYSPEGDVFHVLVTLSGGKCVLLSVIDQDSQQETTRIDEWADGDEVLAVHGDSVVIYMNSRSSVVKITQNADRVELPIKDRLFSVSPDQKKVAVFTGDCLVLIDLQSNNMIPLWGPSKGSVSQFSAKFSTSGKLVFYLDYERCGEKVRQVFSVEADCLSSFETDATFEELLFVSSLEVAAIGRQSNVLHLACNNGSFCMIDTMAEYRLGIWSFAVSSDQKKIILGLANGQLLLFHVH